MKVQCFTVGMFDVNTYLLTDEETGHSAIVDTGEGEQLVDILKKENPNIQMILLTHAHIDHAGALTYLQKTWDVPTYMPRLGKVLFDTLPMQGSMFGMPALNRPCGRIDHLIDDGFEVMLGNTNSNFYQLQDILPVRDVGMTNTTSLLEIRCFLVVLVELIFP